MVEEELWSKVKFSSLDDLSLPLEDNEIRFLLASRDSFEVTYNEKKVVLNQREFLIVNRNGTCVSDESIGALLISLFVDSAGLQTYGNETRVARLAEGCSAAERTSEDEQVEECLIRLIKIRLQPRDYVPADMLKYYYDLLSLIMQYYVADARTGLDNLFFLGEQEKKAYEIKRYVDARYRKTITLDFVAKKFHYSSPYVSRLFKRVFNQPFHRYITALRIRSAVSDMLKTNASITTIALANGFPNVAAFGSSFKQHYHVTPREYRKENKDRLKRERVARQAAEPRQQMESMIAMDDAMSSRPIELRIHDVFGDASRTKPLNDSWRAAINLGPAESLTSSQLRDQIHRIQEDVGFTYGRLWGLFTDSMLMVEESCQTYSFMRIDDVLDMLMKEGIIPFLVLGQKPLAVIANLRGDWLHYDNSYRYIAQPGIDQAAFVQDFIFHCIVRWGKQTVSRWQIELWYPSRGVEAQQYLPDQDVDRVDRYLSEFSALSTAIKKVLPAVRVGGCGLSVDLDANSTGLILKKWSKATTPDFFSISVYPQVQDLVRDDFKLENTLSSDPDKIVSMIRGTTTLLSHYGWDKMPLYVTEWNISVSDRNYVHDSLFKAVYVIRNVLQCADLVEVFAYWQLSDVFGSIADSSGILHGGSGLLTRDNIRKPSYCALQLLDKMRGNIHHLQEHALITSESFDRINALVLNYKHFNSIYYFSKENDLKLTDLDTIFENNLPMKGTIAIDGVLPGTYLLKSWKLDHQHGDVLSKWIEWGQIKDLGNAEIDYLRTCCVPQLTVSRFVVTDRIRLHFELDENAVVVFELYRLLK